MKRTLIIITALLISLTSFGQTSVNKRIMLDTLQTKAPSYSPILTGTVTWDAITGKPTLFPPSAHTHDLLYRPLTWVPTWNDVSGKPLFHAVAISGSYNDLKDKPVTMELSEAIPALPGLDLPRLTQTQINALTPVEGKMIWNLTDHVLQIYNGTKWVIYPTAN